MTRSSPWLTDEVWAQLDPAVGRVSPRDRRWVAAGGLALVLVAAAFVVARISGELRPRISSDTYSATVNTSSHTAVVRYELRNDGWFDETVTGIDQTASFIDLTRASATHFVIPAGSTRSVVLTFHLRDCTKVDNDQPRVRLHLDRFWGTTTTTVPSLFFDPTGPIGEICGSN